MDAPCKGCEDRVAGTKHHPSCHATCEKYKNYKTKVDEQSEEKRKEAEFVGYIKRANRRFEKMRR